MAMSKAPKQAIVMPTPEEDEAITAAALSDPDAQPLTPEQLKAMVPMRTKPQRKPDAPPSATRRRR
jgi:hypothetical protein